MFPSSFRILYSAFMVLFLEAETLRLLDLYVALRANPDNLAISGVLLRQSAREQLTIALNASFPRKNPWTEGQVSVKFKNLRSEYSELKWLSTQPGFHADGVGMSDDWWRAAKIRRPKCRAFKGKLPWVFESRMRVILSGKPHMMEMNTQPEGEKEVGRQLVVRGQEEEQEGAALLVPSPLHKRKRDDNVRNPIQRHRNGDWESNSTTTPNFEGTGDRTMGYGHSLVSSVEQSAVAAAGMARGFQDLITMFQEEAMRCRAMEQQTTHEDGLHPSLADQRSVLLTIAHSLEHSTRATADMAKGYRELVSAFVRETNVQRQENPESVQ